MFACRVERGANAMPRNVLKYPRFADTATEVDQSADYEAISFDDYLPICIDELEQERKLHRGIRVNQVAALFHEAGLADDECMDYAAQALDGELEALSLNASPGKASPMQQICEVCNEDDPATIRILFIHHDSYARQNKEDMNFFCNDVFPFSDKKDRKRVGVTHVGEAQKAIHDFFMSDGEEINAGGALQAAIVFLGHGVDGKFCLPSGEVIGIHEIEQFVRKCWEESRLQRPETRLPATAPLPGLLATTTSTITTTTTTTTTRLPATVKIIFAECGSRVSTGQCKKFTAVHLPTDLQSKEVTGDGRKCYVVVVDSDKTQRAGENSAM